ncbi:MAG: hypothetical protein VYE22_36210 [Myxococcota bacterium]|nr:hypothetical protein [Myxococcota bacterium]
MRAACVPLLTAALAVGCSDASVVADAGAPPPLRRDVDLLFVVDSSGSMVEEQSSFAADMSTLVAMLTRGDVDGDGLGDVEPPASVQVGFVTSDLGVGDSELPTCDSLGEDAQLREVGCGEAHPAVQTLDPDVDLELAARDLACVARVGEGCGFEQPLEAMLKAASPAAATDWTAPGYVPPVFARGAAGRGDAHGLVRPGTVLAVVLISDDDDCSARDPGFFDPSTDRYGDLSSRCVEHAEDGLHPVSRYVDGLLQLRHRPERLVYVPIAGVPVDLAPAPGEPIAWPTLTGPEGDRDLRLLQRPDPTRPGALLPSCDIPGRGATDPPLRLLRVAEALEARGARVGAVSVCQDDGYLAPVARAILEAL